MKIIVQKEKILNYLLKPRLRNDKSQFLNKLGFFEYNWEFLRSSILNIFHEYIPESIEENEYGTIYNVCGILRGTNNNTLYVKTIWINLYSSKEIKFVTLFPERT